MKVCTRTICVILCSSAVPFFLLGCIDKTRLANVELRKNVQSLESQIEQLNRRHEADVATIKALQQQEVPTTLPYDQLQQLYTTHGLKLGKLTSANARGVKIYATPIDDEGQDLKTAGSFVVEARDANQPEGALLAHCEYTIEQARKAWRGQFLSYGYVLECPWSAPPPGSSIRVKVTFRDALTGREFRSEKVIEREPG